MIGDGVVRKIVEGAVLCWQLEVPWRLCGKSDTGGSGMSVFGWSRSWNEKFVYGKCLDFGLL